MIQGEGKLDITASSVKELRERTGAGVMECKRALQAAGGDMNKAAGILQEQGMARADKKSDRVATQGVVEAYIHAGGRIGAMVEVNCETDFVARTDDFRRLAHDIAMQIAATGPRYLATADVPADDQPRAAELALLAQPFIKDGSVTIEDLIKRNVAKIGEAIRVRRFSRFALGEDTVEAGK
jgi:elongation factor Ts